MPDLLAPSAVRVQPENAARPAWRWSLLAICIALVALASPPRLVRLGALSFYADEDLTALAARSVTAGLPAQMPTGMAYRRALPYTWLTARAGELLGGPEEFAFRLPVALIGILSVPAFFLLARRITRTRVALIAALLLAFSEWHLVYSRQARMYGPFLLCFLAAAVLLASWPYTARRSDLIGGILAFVAAVSLHALALFALVPAASPLLLPDPRRVSARRVLGLLLLLGIAAVVFDRVVVATPYAEWLAPIQRSGAGPARGAWWFPAWLVTLHPVAWIGASLGAIAGLEAARRAEPAEAADGAWLRRSLRLGGGLGGGLLLGLGQLYGALLLFAAALVTHPSPRREIVRRSRTPLLVLTAIALAWGLSAPVLFGVRGAVRWAFLFPFPYAAFVATLFPGVAALAAAAALGLVLRGPAPENRGRRIAALSVIAALVAMGAVSQWGGTRYFFFVYPFILLLASAALLAGVDFVVRRWWRGHAEVSVPVAALLVASGLLGGHGVPQTVRTVLLQHGERVDSGVHGFPFRPDHRSVGEALRRLRRAGDVVIAEDPTEVYLYAGPVDHWLRARSDARRYLYRDDHGLFRDFYVGSALAESASALDSIVGVAPGRVWLVTSGETRRLRALYLSQDQREWLEPIEAQLAPVSTGQDGASRLYCLNCASNSR